MRKKRFGQNNPASDYEQIMIAKDLGYEYLVVDGTQGIDDNFVAVEKVFNLNVL